MSKYDKDNAPTLFHQKEQSRPPGYYMTYRGFTGTIEGDEDDVFYGKVTGIRDIISFHGATPSELKKEFQISVDAYLEYCDKNNIEVRQGDLDGDEIESFMSDTGPTSKVDTTNTYSRRVAGVMAKQQDNLISTYLKAHPEVTIEEIVLIHEIYDMKSTWRVGLVEKS